MTLFFQLYTTIYVYRHNIHSTFYNNKSCPHNVYKHILQNVVPIQCIAPIIFNSWLLLQTQPCPVERKTDDDWLSHTVEISKLTHSIYQQSVDHRLPGGLFLLHPALTQREWLDPAEKSPEKGKVILIQTFLDATHVSQSLRPPASHPPVNNCCSGWWSYEFHSDQTNRGAKSSNVIVRRSTQNATTTNFFSVAFHCREYNAFWLE